MSPSESDRPRRSIGFDETTPFETKLKLKNQWVQAHLTDAKAALPFSFVYEGKERRFARGRAAASRRAADNGEEKVSGFRVRGSDPCRDRQRR